MLYGNLPGDNPDISEARTSTPYGIATNPNDTTAYAFAAVPQYHTDPWSATRDQNRYVPQSIRPLKPDGSLNLHNKDWSGTTYMLAPCPKPTDTKDIKSMVLEHAIEAIRTTSAKWKNKTDCLVNHFNQRLILTSATLAIEDFQRYENGPLYEYRFIAVQSTALRNINIPQAGGNHANFRSTVRYVVTEMTIDPRRRFQIPHRPGNHLLPGADTKTVMFRLPQGRDGNLHEAIDIEMLRNMQQLITTCLFLQDAPQFGMAEREQFSQDRFNTWIEELKQHTKYEIVARLIRPAFVGEGIIESPVNRLVQCQQRGTNEKGQTTAATIAEHYARFTAIVHQLNPEEQYPINLPITFYNSLTPHMQDKLNRRQYQHPPPSNNQDQLAQLQRLRDMAMEEEREIETQIQLIKTTVHPTTSGPRTGYSNTRGPTPRATTRAFMATHNNANDDTTDGDEDPLMEQFHITMKCFLSPAESALRNASGTERPIECWGCTGHATFHSNRYHSFRDCPNKYDPEVRRTAFRRMKQMREEWEAKKQEQHDPKKRKREGTIMIARADAMREWRELGFPTKRDAERAADAAAMMAVEMSDQTRQHMARQWNKKWSNGNGNQATDETTGEISDNYYRDTSSRHAYNFIVRVFQATPARTPLEISPTLPHCQFPIGNQHGRGKIKVALDSCAGVNIGHLEFHKAMSEIFPELVASFKAMSEYGEKEVNIGGVEVSATNLKITHIIEYRTPFRYNGNACSLTFGLSEQAAATAILSINFLRKTKALWSYDDAEPNVHLTIWNTTLKVQYEPPTRREAPTQQTRFRDETTAVYTASVKKDNETTLKE